MYALLLCLLMPGDGKYVDPEIHYFSPEEEKLWIDRLPKFTTDPKLALLLSRPLIPYNHDVLPRVLQQESGDGVETPIRVMSGDYNLSMSPKPKYGSPTMDPQWRHTAGFHEGIPVTTYIALPNTGNIEISRVMTDPVGAPGFIKRIRATNLVVHKFPVGTSFIEVGFNRVDGELLPFEVRTRTKFKEGVGVGCWSINAYVPCRNPREYVAAAEKFTGTRRSFGDLLRPSLFRRETFRFDGPRFEHNKIDFTMHVTDLPELESSTVKSILKNEPFKSKLDMGWLENGDIDCHAPVTDKPNQIYPVGYKGAFFPTSKKTCIKCHEDDGKNAFNEIGDDSWYGYTPGYDNIRSWTPIRIQGGGEMGEEPHLDRVLSNSPRVKHSGLPIGSVLPRGLK